MQTKKYIEKSYFCMIMSSIPIHKTSELFQGEIAQMRYISGEEKLSVKAHAHRDDYYIFLLIEEGKDIVLVDFEEHEITENNIYYVLPGQVHYSGDRINFKGWFLAVDNMLVKSEHKEIFEKSVITGYTPKPNEDTINALRSCAAIIYNRLKSNRQNIGQQILHDLLSAYIGMIAEIYQEGLNPSANKRSTIITYEFKALLSANYRSMKQPSQYAAKMNISPIYLYEAVKQTTGQSVSDYIRNEVVVQAKRLLFYTDMSVKEIALELGYEDYAYFTRLFTKASKLSPTQFRKKYLK